MTFADSVFEEFQKFGATWSDLGDSRNFWRTGNALDTCIDFVVAAKAAWGDSDPRVKEAVVAVRKMLDEAHGTYLKNYENDKNSKFDRGNWWDDYGWWGIAYLKAYENYAIFGQPDEGPSNCYDAGQTMTEACCLQLAHDCWAVMQDKAWDRGQYNTNPPVPGGCWNHRPDGSQNTVTNSLYLVLSIRLYTATKQRADWESRSLEYLEAACEQFRWFARWFIKGPKAGTEIGIYDHVPSQTWSDPDKYWILERPTNGMNDPNYNNGLPYYKALQEKQFWTGDQGLLLGGLIGLVEEKEAINKTDTIRELDNELRNDKIADSSIDYAVKLIYFIVAGVTSRLFTKTLVLHEAPFVSEIRTYYSTDYATGKGVLMRYLAFARPRLQGHQSGLELDYDRLVIETAASICRCPADPSKNAYGFIWDNIKSQDITPAQTNEGDFQVPTLGTDLQQWVFAVGTTRLDGLSAAIPLNSRINE